VSFSYNRDLREQNLKQRKPIDSGVSFRSFGNNHKNVFASLLKDQNLDPRLDNPGEFSDEAAEDYYNERMPYIDNAANFQDKESNKIASNFLGKYIRSNIVPEKVSAENTLEFIKGNPNDGLLNRYPGSEGTATS
jgi:hypothetical protein